MNWASLVDGIVKLASQLIEIFKGWGKGIKDAVTWDDADYIKETTEARQKIKKAKTKKEFKDAVAKLYHITRRMR